MDFSSSWHAAPDSVRDALRAAEATDAVALGRFIRRSEVPSRVLERVMGREPSVTELEAFLLLLAAARRAARRFAEEDDMLTEYELQAKRLRSEHDRRLAWEEAWYLNAGRSAGAGLVCPVAHLHVRSRSTLRAGGRPARGQGLAAAREGEVRQKYVEAIVSLLLSAQPTLPSVAAATQTGDARAVLSMVAAGRRASTLRTRYRAWVNFTRWLQAAHNVNWPTDWRTLLEYLRIRVSEPCGRQTILGLYYATTFWERAAGVHLTNDPLWKAAVEEMLSMVAGRAGHRASISAQPPLLRHLQLLEGLVCDIGEPNWLRAYAAWKLIQAWCAFRFDDHRGAAPRDIEASETHFVFLLRRTKTTGMGKKVELRRVPLSLEAYLVESQWMSVGLQLIREMGADGRDYLMPSPEKGLSIARGCELTYQEAAGWSRSLYAKIGITLGHDEREAQILGQHYSEHSGRSFLPSTAMAMGATEEFLKPIGGWGARAAQSYMKAAVTRTLQVQQRVAVALRRNWERFDVAGEADRIAQLAKHFAEHGLEDGEAAAAARRSELTAVKPTQGACWDGPQEDGRASEEGEAGAAPAADDAESTETRGDHSELHGYVVSVTPKTGFRRLHYYGKCHRHPGVHYQHYEWLGREMPGAEAYDDYCRQCWREAEPRGQAGSVGVNDKLDDVQGSDPELSELDEDHSSSTDGGQGA